MLLIMRCLVFSWENSTLRAIQLPLHPCWYIHGWILDSTWYNGIVYQYVHCDLILLCNNCVAWLKWWPLQVLISPRFRDSLENDIIVVHAIQSDHKISSYRLVKPSKYSKTKRASQSERRPSKFERFEKEGTGRKDSQRDTGNINDKKAFESIFIKISKLNSFCEQNLLIPSHVTKGG